jgi:hypothetical protein
MTGHWEARELVWHDTDVLNCPVCGRLITARAWVFPEPDTGGELRACEPGCEELYFSYLKPTHGALVT